MSFPLRRSKIISFLFLVIIALPALAGLAARAPSDAIAALENRAAAPWPRTPASVADLNAAPRAIDAFLEDRFGFRDGLIAFNQWMTRRLDLGFGEEKAIIGKDGWLFLTDGGALDMHMGRTPFRDGEAAAWLDAAEALREAAKTRDAAFAVLLAPQKASVYGEYLPDYVSAGRSMSRHDLLIQGARLRGLPFADAKARLIERKGAAKLYYQSDTHWTARGAWEGYQALIDVLEKTTPTLYRLDAARVHFRETEFSGDLARMLNQQERFAETAPSLAIKNATPFETVEVDAFSYGAFPTQITTTDADDKPTLLMIGDSYAYALIPFLRESFSRIVFTHHQLGAFDRAVLDEYPSDFVVLQMVERMLVHPLAPPERTGGT